MVEDQMLGMFTEEERFALLVNLCKKISDFGHDPTAGKDAGIDETYGIPVQFDNVDDDDDAEDVYGEVKERGDVSDDEEEDDDDDEVVMAEDTGIHGVSNIAGNR